MFLLRIISLTRHAHLSQNFIWWLLDYFDNSLYFKQTVNVVSCHCIVHLTTHYFKRTVNRLRVVVVLSIWQLTAWANCWQVVSCRCIVHLTTHRLRSVDRDVPIPPSTHNHYCASLARSQYGTHTELDFHRSTITFKITIRVIPMADFQIPPFAGYHNNNNNVVFYGGSLIALLHLQPLKHNE